MSTRIIYLKKITSNVPVSSKSKCQGDGYLARRTGKGSPDTAYVVSGAHQVGWYSWQCLDCFTRG